MLTKIKLTKKQKEFLFNLKRNSPSEIIRDRAHAVLLRDENETLENIAKTLFRSTDFVNQAIKKFRSGELDGLNMTGHNYRISPQKRTNIINLIKSKSPDELKGFKFKEQFWTVDILKTVIKRKYKTEYKTEKSYHDLFRAAGFSFHKPKAKDYRQDKKKIKDFKGALKKSLTTTKIRLSW